MTRQMKMDKQKTDICDFWQNFFQLMEFKVNETIIENKEITLKFSLKIGSERVMAIVPDYAYSTFTFLVQGRRLMSDELVEMVLQNSTESNSILKENFQKTRHSMYEFSTFFKEEVKRQFLILAKEKIEERIAVSHITGAFEKNGMTISFLIKFKNGLVENLKYKPRDNGGYVNFFDENKNNLNIKKLFKENQPELLEINFPVSLERNQHLFVKDALNAIVKEKYEETEEFKLKTIFQ